MYNIAIIGLGSIGKRHLESILKSSMPLKIYIVDSDNVAIETARIMDKERIISGENIDILPKTLELAIIATSSSPRRKVFEQLVLHSKVKYIIFEKILFQRVEDYYEVDKILQVNNIKAWVDCPRREFENYQIIKKELQNADYFTFDLTGGEWGFACNVIHLLDLIQYLSGGQNLKIEEVDLFPIIIESKRKGYKELFGRISGQVGKCRYFTINCYPKSKLPELINIAADNCRYVISEGQNKMWYMSEKNNWIIEEKHFEYPFISQISQKIVENILLNGKCNLSEYNESMQLHLEFLKPLIKFFEDNGMEKGICPIT
jgi:hypothetical protein